jgi:hypothetical protein
MIRSFIVKKITVVLIQKKEAAFLGQPPGKNK